MFSRTHFSAASSTSLANLLINKYLIAKSLFLKDPVIVPV